MAKAMPFCHAGLCRFGERFSFIEYIVGRAVVKPLLGAFLVEVVQVVGDALFALLPSRMRADRLLPA